MVWAINIASAILLTTFTGTFLLGIWYVVGKILEKSGYVNIVFNMLKIELIFWLIPIAYLILYVNNDRRWGGILFRPTERLGVFCLFFFSLWLCGVVLAIHKMIKQTLPLHKRYRMLPRVEGPVYEAFEKKCDELKIPRGKVQLVCDSRLAIPAMGGLLHHYLILPDREYTSEQLEIIFVHELTHYRQNNHVMRYFGMLVFALHFFNPVIWQMKRVIQYWGEYSCDYEAVEITGSAKKYFSVIIELITMELYQNPYLSSLYQSKSELESRIELVQKNHRLKKKSKLLAALAMIFMIVSSTLMVETAAISFGNHYYTIYMKTVSMKEDEPNKESTKAEELQFSELAPGTIVEHENDTNSALLYGLNTFSWTINAKRVKMGNIFYADAGQKIQLAVEGNFSSAVYYIGIAQPDGTLRYVCMTGGGNHTFELTQAGSYALFAQNMDDTSIDIAGVYNIE